MWLGSQTNLRACFISRILVLQQYSGIYFWYYNNTTNFTPGITWRLRENGFIPWTIRIFFFSDFSFTHCNLHSESTLLPGAPVGWYGDQTKKKFIYVIREEGMRREVVQERGERKKIESIKMNYT